MKQVSGGTAFLIRFANGISAGGRLLQASVLAVLSCSLAAKPVIYYANGSKPEDIQPVIDLFKRDIVFGAGFGPEMPPLQRGWFNEATFDGISTQSGITVTNGFSLSLSDTASLWPTPGAWLLIGSAGLLDGVERGPFADLNAGFDEWFPPYSPPAVISSVSVFGNGTTQLNLAPGRSISAFGAVFIDVDQPNSTELRTFGFHLPYPLFLVPGGAEDGAFTFYGVILDAGETFEAVSVGFRSLNATIDPAQEGSSYFNDYIAIDNLIYGEIAIVPEPSAAILSLLGVGAVFWARMRRKQDR